MATLSKIDLCKKIKDDISNLSQNELEEIFKIIYKTNNNYSKNNLELSARRATNTHDTLLQSAPDLGRYLNLDGEPVLSVAAYGEQRPVVPNVDEQARDKNRRIDIRFVMWIPKSVESFKNQMRKFEDKGVKRQLSN